MPPRIGLVGTGRMGRRYINLLAPDMPLVMRARPELGGDFCPTELGAFLVASDAVIVASPAPTHADIVIAALAAGKPVLCEKPLCTSRSDLSRVRSAWERSGTPLLVDHTHLWHPSMDGFRSACDGRLGVEMRAWFGDAETPWDWMDWAPHPMSIAAMLGYPERGRLRVERGPFGARRRVFEANIDGTVVRYDADQAQTYPTTLARVVDDFCHLRVDWRWCAFAFRVMDLVLEGAQ